MKLLELRLENFKGIRQITFSPGGHGATVFGDNGTGKTTLADAYFWLLNGFEKLLYMTKEEVEAYAEKYSPSYNSNYSPWKTEFDKMAQKTVLRKLIGTYGVMTPDMQTAVVTDDTGATPQQEIEQKANRGGMVDINPDTGEVLNADDLPPAEEENPRPKKRPF